MEKLKGLFKKIYKHKIKTCLIVGMMGLAALTISKDNVHFGSVTLHNPQGNHYVWGLIPVTRIAGNAKGNFRTRQYIRKKLTR